MFICFKLYTDKCNKPIKTTFNNVDNVQNLYIFSTIFVQMKYNNSFRVSFPDSTYYSIKKLKDITGIGVQDIVRRALEDYTEREVKRLIKQRNLLRTK